MTNEEAIKAIRDNFPPTRYTILKESLERSMFRYSNMREALEMAIEALDKQIPKKPLVEGVGGFNAYICPYCQCNYVNDKAFCDCCGQAIYMNDKGELKDDE